MFCPPGPLKWQHHPIVLASIYLTTLALVEALPTQLFAAAPCVRQWAGAAWQAETKERASPSETKKDTALRPVMGEEALMISKSPSGVILFS